jgi:hypothetical protein
MPLRPQVTLHVLEKWEIYFFGPINPQTKCQELDISWEEVAPVKYCSVETVAHFLFKQVINRFGCPRILMSDQGTHFINNTIMDMTKEFEVYH